MEEIGAKLPKFSVRMKNEKQVKLFAQLLLVFFCVFTSTGFSQSGKAEKQLIKTVVIGDVHTEPYTSIFGDLLDQVNWIPLDYFSSDNEIKSSLMSFFNACGHDIKLPLDNVRAWKSSTNKIKLQNFIDDLFLKNNNPSIYLLYKLYANDLKFYHNLIDNFTPDWQHIQGKISKVKNTKIK